MKLKINWQHVGATLVTLLPVALHLLQVVRPTWYSSLTSLFGVAWLLFTKSVVVDPGVKS